MQITVRGETAPAASLFKQTLPVAASMTADRIESGQRSRRSQTAATGSNKLFAREPAADAEDVGRLDGGVELDVVAFAAPEKASVSEKIVDLVGVGIHGTEILKRDINVGILRPARVEVNHHDDDV